MTLLKDSGWILGKISAGTPTFIQNAGFVWAAILLPLVIAAWFGMNNPVPLSPNYGGTLVAFSKILYLWGLTCLVGGLGLYLYLPAPTGLGLLNMWVALPLIMVAIMVATLFVMKLAAFGEMKGNIAKQFEIFKNKHTWSMTALYKSAPPEEYFLVFMVLFVVLFAATGIGNGSTFRTIGVIFDRQQAGPVLGWTSAAAAYGAFIAPVVIGTQVKAGTPEYSMYGFAAFYAACLVLNWWFYLRADSEIKNP